MINLISKAVTTVPIHLGSSAQGSAYTVLEQAAPYATALAECRSRGLTLPRPLSPEENALLHAATGDGDFFLDLTLDKARSVFVAADGSDYSWANWPTGVSFAWGSEPSRNGEGCIIMLKWMAPEAHAATWGDTPCSHHAKQIVCQGAAEEGGK